MPLLFFDGFDMYQSNTQPAMRGWAGAVINGISDAGRFGTSRAISILGNGNDLTQSLTASSTVSVGFALKTAAVSSLAATGGELFRFLNGTTLQCKVGIKSDGSLVTGRGDFTTNNIGTSAAGLITSGAWNYIEIELTRNAATGILKVWLNGTLVINSTNVNTGASNIDKVALAGASSSNHTFDDFYLTNDATRLGERRVDYLPPSADTATEDWTPSTGTNSAALLDEIPMNNDTDYVSSATVGHKDLFDMTNLSSTPTVIDGVQTVLAARKDDAATRDVRTNFKSGTTTVNGTTRAMSAGYVISSDLYLLDPDTGAAWTAAGVNASQLGFEVVT